MASTFRTIETNVPASWGITNDKNVFEPGHDCGCTWTRMGREVGRWINREMLKQQTMHSNVYMVVPEGTKYCDAIV